MSYEDIPVTQASAVSTVTINRPQLLNATRPQTLMEIVEALKELAHDDTVRVVVFTGCGCRAFSVGADISHAEKLELPDALKEHLLGQQMCTAVEDFPKPVIARINGFALGGQSWPVAAIFGLLTTAQNWVFRRSLSA